LCANNGNNNCIHSSDFSDKGANIVAVYFKPPSTKTEMVENGTETVPIEMNWPPNDHPVIVGINKKLDLYRRGSNDKDHLNNFICANYQIYLMSFAFGYADYDPTKINSEVTKIFINPNVEPGGKPNRRKKITFETFGLTLNGKGNIVNSAGTKYRWLVPNNGADGCSIDLKYPMRGCVTYDNLKSISNCTKTVPKFEEKITPIPGELVFNPKKDSSGKHVPGNDAEGIVYRLNKTSNSNIKIDSQDQTLIFSTGNITNKIYAADKNNIEPLNKPAEIIISDTKRGVGKNAKKVCINVLGATKIVSGDKDCAF